MDTIEIKKLFIKILKYFNLQYKILGIIEMDAAEAPEKLKKYFFKQPEFNTLNMVINGHPFYYNNKLKTWRRSSLAFIWGHKGVKIDVIIINDNKIPTNYLIAPVDWSL
jgi:hypothetical protein